MPTNLRAAVRSYLRGGNPAVGTPKEYLSTLRKWDEWGAGVPFDEKPGEAGVFPEFVGVVVGSVEIGITKKEASSARIRGFE